MFSIQLRAKATFVFPLRTLSRAGARSYAPAGPRALVHPRCCLLVLHMQSPPRSPPLVCQAEVRVLLVLSRPSQSSSREVLFGHLAMKAALASHRAHYEAARSKMPKPRAPKKAIVPVRPVAVPSAATATAGAE